MAELVPWISANWGMIFGVLFGMSEALAVIPSVKANSVFQAVMNFLKSMKPPVAK